MSKKNLLLFAIAFFFKGNLLFAQTLNDPIYLNYSLINESKVQDDIDKSSLVFLEFNAALKPIEISKKVKFINGLYYRNTTIDFSSASILNDKIPNTIHDIRYSAIIRAELSKKCEFVTIAKVMVRSDFTSQLNSNDVFPQVVSLFNYSVRNNPNFKIGLGLALNNDFERNAIIPIGSFYYENEKFKVELIYPNANFIYKRSNDFEFGLFASVDGAISRMANFTIDNKQAEYLRTFQLIAAPGVSHRLFNDFFGHLKIGFTPVRNFEILDGDFNKINTSKIDFESSLFFRLGISYRLRK